MIFLASGDDDVCNYCAAASSRECDLDTAPVSQCGPVSRVSQLPGATLSLTPSTRTMGEMVIIMGRVHIIKNMQRCNNIVNVCHPISDRWIHSHYIDSIDNFFNCESSSSTIYQINL